MEVMVVAIEANNVKPVVDNEVFTLGVFPRCML